jgi:hypothetical protein
MSPTEPPLPPRWGLRPSYFGFGTINMSLLRSSGAPNPAGYESVIPNPKLKLLEQIREVMRLGTPTS